MPKFVSAATEQRRLCSTRSLMVQDGKLFTLV
jgi:hypothetical protein